MLLTRRRNENGRAVNYRDQDKKEKLDSKGACVRVTNGRGSSALHLRRERNGRGIRNVDSLWKLTTVRDGGRIAEKQQAEGLQDN